MNRDFGSFIYLKLSPGWSDLPCRSRKNYDRCCAKRGDVVVVVVFVVVVSPSSQTTLSLLTDIEAGILLTWRLLTVAIRHIRVE